MLSYPGNLYKELKDKNFMMMARTAVPGAERSVNTDNRVSEKWHTPGSIDSYVE